MSTTPITFGPFVLDPERGSLFRGDVPLAIGHRGCSLLVSLLDAKGAVVTKSDLMETGWPGLTVEEGNLTVQIALLRKQIGPGPQGQDWIVTVPRLGYRLVTPQALLTGSALWTQRFDGDNPEIFDFQDRITETVATLVAPAIDASELAQARLRQPDSADSYDIYPRARTLLNDESQESNDKAIALLTGALKLEPDSALILGQVAWALEHRGAMDWPPFAADDHQKCVEYARSGIRLAGGDPRIMAHCAVALIQTGKDYEAEWPSWNRPCWPIPMISTCLRLPG